MNSLFSLTVLVTVFAAMIGCTRSQRVCNLDVLETDDYYVDGQHCATNQLPLWSAMESGEAILRVHVREPEEFPIFEFARFFGMLSIVLAECWCYQVMERFPSESVQNVHVIGSARE